MLSQLPGLGHHDSEVLVSVDRGRHVSVVFAELVESDDAVGVLSVPQAHELTVSLLWGLLACHHVGVLAHVVDASDVVQGHLTVAVDVKLVVGLSDVATTAIVEVAAKGNQELVEVNSATVVSIEVLNENLGLLLGQVDVEVLHAPHKLIGINLPVSIIVQDAEDSGDAADGHRTALLQGLFDVCDHLGAVVTGRGLNGLSCGSVLRKLNSPVVFLTDSFRVILTDSLTVVFTSEHLSFVLGGSRHAGNFHLVAEVVSVGDSVIAEQLVSGAMLKDDAVIGENWLAVFGLADALSWPNLP